MKNTLIGLNKSIIFLIGLATSGTLITKPLQTVLVVGTQKKQNGPTFRRRQKKQSKTAKILKKHKAKQNQPKIMKVHDPVPEQVLASIAATCLQLSKIVSNPENEHKVEQGICTALAGFFNVAAQAMKSYRKQYTQKDFIPLLNMLDDQAKERIRILILTKTIELQETTSKNTLQDRCNPGISLSDFSN